MKCIDAWSGESRTGCALRGVILASDVMLAWLATSASDPETAMPPGGVADRLWPCASEPGEQLLEPMAVGTA